MRNLVPVRTVAPGVDLIEVARARSHCRIDHTDDDDLLREIIASVTGALEAPAGILRVCLLKQTWRASWSGFPSTCRIRLPIEPLISISTVEYIPEGSTTWTAFSSDYWSAYSDDLGGWVELVDDADWPDTATRPEAVRITFTAGYGVKATDVPPAILHAARLMIGHFYENREESIVGVTAQSLPLGCKALLAPFLRVPV